MGMKSCGKGHFYDERTHSTCPYCGVPIDLGETVGRPPDAVSVSPGTASEDFPKTRAAGSRGPRRDPEETVGIFRKRLGLDPVVGWLVCIEGPDRGRDYRVHAERNFIGRDATMDIVIAGDTSISCENHAVLSYNPKRHTFNLAPGDGRGLTYLTDEELLAAAPLAPTTPSNSAPASSCSSPSAVSASPGRWPPTRSAEPLPRPLAPLSLSLSLSLS